jgi:hypothetical protein
MTPRMGFSNSEPDPVEVEAKNFRYPEKGMSDNPLDHEIRSKSRWTTFSSLPESQDAE